MSTDGTINGLKGFINITRWVASIAKKDAHTYTHIGKKSAKYTEVAPET